MTHPLTAYRKKHDLTLSALGESLGATKGMVSKWESGKALPRLRYMSRIEQVSNGEITISELVRSFSNAQAEAMEVAI